MSDRSYLNKAKPEKIDIIFNNNKKINEAILILVEKAYLNHHEEQKQIRIKLTECLEKDAKFLIGQLSDQSFVEKLKESADDIISENIKIPSIDKQKLSDAIGQALSGYVKQDDSDTARDSKGSNTSSKASAASRLFEDKDYTKIIDRIIEFNSSILTKIHSDRIEKIKSTFNSIGYNNAYKNNKISSISNSVRLKNKNSTSETSIKDTNSVLNGVITKNIKSTKEFTDKQAKSLKSKIGGGHNVGILKGLGKGILKGFMFIGMTLMAFAIKTSLKLILGTLKTAFKLAFGLIKGTAKLIGGIVKGAFKTVSVMLKTGFKLIFGTLRFVYKSSAVILKGLAKLTVGFLPRIKKFLLTPTGMWLIGFVIGFAAIKLIKFKDKIIGKILYWKNRIEKEVRKYIDKSFDWISQKRYQAFELIDDTNKHYEEIKDKIIGTLENSELNRKLRFIVNGKLDQTKLFCEIIPKSWVDLQDALANMTQKTTGAVGAIAGAGIGSLVAMICRGFVFGNIPGVGGLLVGLGAIFGEIVGEWLGKVPEQSSDKSQHDKIIGTIRSRYQKNKKQSIGSSVKSLQKLSESLKKREMDRYKKSGHADFKQKNKVDDFIRDILEKNKTLIVRNMESDDERNKHDKYLGKLNEEVDQYYGKDYLSYMFSPFMYDTKEHMFEIDDKLDALIGDGSDYWANGNLSENYKKILVDIGKIKIQAYESAREQYDLNQIPFGEIFNYANGVVNDYVNTATVVRKNMFGPDDTVPLMQYLQNGCKDFDYDELQGIDIKDTLRKKASFITRQDSVALELQKKFVEFMEKTFNVKLTDEQKDNILTLYQLFCRNNKIASMRHITSSRINKEKLAEINKIIRDQVFIDDKSDEQKQLDIIQKSMLALADASMKVKLGDERNAKDLGKLEEVKRGVKQSKYPQNVVTAIAKREELQKQRNKLWNEVNDFIPVVGSTIVPSGEKPPEEDPNARTGIEDGGKQQRLLPPMGSTMLNGISL